MIKILITLNDDISFEEAEGFIQELEMREGIKKVELENRHNGNCNLCDRIG